MRKLTAIALATCFALTATADINVQATVAVELSSTPVAQVLPVWQPEGATEISFEVLRKGKPFGWHNLSFLPTDDGGFTARSDIELTAKIGPITAYKYRHDSVETWQDGRLVGLEAETRKNGKSIVARAEVTEAGLLVEGTNYNDTYPATIIPANHWNISQLYSDTMLSTEGGQPLDVVVEILGRETLTIAGQPIEATKFKLVSDLTVLLWYDDNGRWLKLDFTARGNQKIEYVLQELY